MTFGGEVNQSAPVISDSPRASRYGVYVVGLLAAAMVSQQCRRRRAAPGCSQHPDRLRHQSHASWRTDQRVHRRIGSGCDPVGDLADRFMRRTVLGIGLMVWSPGDTADRTDMIVPGDPRRPGSAGDWRGHGRTCRHIAHWRPLLEQHVRTGDRSRSCRGWTRPGHRGAVRLQFGWRSAFLPWGRARCAAGAAVLHDARAATRGSRGQRTEVFDHP
jgi:hypothetical protein